MRTSSFVPSDIRQTETPADVFFNRRLFIQAAAAGVMASGPLACMANQDGDAAGGLLAGRDPITIPVSYPEGFTFARNPKYVLPEGLRK
ncbi:MAG: hypothetical protein KC983_04310, partial [Phycisphaerales bacterium]|nr:hypothetical protein [Phycisphaerales bacterium]